MEPHAIVEEHSHPHEQMGLMLEGEAVFTIGGLAATRHRRTNVAHPRRNVASRRRRAAARARARCVSSAAEKTTSEQAGRQDAVRRDLLAGRRARPRGHACSGRLHDNAVAQDGRSTPRPGSINRPVSPIASTPAGLHEPLDVTRVEGQHVVYDQVASSPLPDQSVGHAHHRASASGRPQAAWRS